ncbi:MAG: DMT family transporter [Proteobacteria bacterium]|nr:DMT family transporter [Pseudomonadota bacterium]
MQVILLYTTVVLIWGSTWAAIPYQFGVVAEEVSVAYRFAIAAVTLFLYAIVAGKKIRLPRRYYPMVIVQGLLLFSINYFFVYYGTAYITSGLVAVTFSSIVVCNAFFERMFFRTPLEGWLLVASFLGMLGIALIFWPEVKTLSLQDRTFFGLLLIVIGVVIASLGNMAAVVNTGRDLPVVAVNAHGMAWGALLSFLAAAILGREFNFSLEPAYVWSLLFLAIFGSAIAFGCYLLLIRKIGSARAAYSSVLFPVVALAISTFLEDYQWSILAVVGISLTIVGNWLALRRTKRPLAAAKQQ